MRIGSSIRRALSIAGIAATFILTLSMTASAATRSSVAQGSSVVAPQGCQSGTYYEDSPVEQYVAPPLSQRIYGDSGTHLVISRGTTRSITGTLGSTTTADAGVVFAKVSEAVSVSVALQKSVTTTEGGDWTVPSNVPRGWIEMGADGYGVQWDKFTYVTPCKKTVLSSGHIVGTTASAWVKHS